jgi:hypothetical protein
MLNETIAAGLNDPNCAFFVGSFTGNFLSFKYLLVVILLFFLFKLLDGLVAEPLLKKFKAKFSKEGKDGIKKSKRK